MEVTRDNFRHVLPQIQQLLTRCEFYSFDCEMTGLFVSPDEKTKDTCLATVGDPLASNTHLVRNTKGAFNSSHYFDDPEDRYEEVGHLIILCYFLLTRTTTIQNLKLFMHIHTSIISLLAVAYQQQIVFCRSIRTFHFYKRKHDHFKYQSTIRGDAVYCIHIHFLCLS